ncbi:hypothetical protein JL722_3500 [Aureococcus anophagefferens]|nr:hypothetical protein JL722_3500 [Aureococcus anophagefferens]
MADAKPGMRKKKEVFKSPERSSGECLKVVEQALEESGGLNEYPLYIKALIMRQQGKIQESLTLFQSATCLNPSNVANLKQVGHSLYLLGKHKAALGVYKQAREMSADMQRSSSDGGRADAGDGNDWELWHNSGLCHAYLKQYDKAIEAFTRANGIGRHDATFMQLGKVYQQMGNHKEALRHQRAFDFLGNSLTHDPKNPKAILAAGSIIQDNKDMDVALHKYRVAAVQTPHSAQLWNNIGMALFGKGKNVAAVSCLKRALYYDPFEWIISFNLGLVHLHTEQYASAFHHFNTSINLKGDYAQSYMYLGVALSKMDDAANAFAAFDKSLKLADDYTTRLNYAIALANDDKPDDARTHLDAYEAMLKDMGPDEEHEEGLLEHAKVLRDKL